MSDKVVVHEEGDGNLTVRPDAPESVTVRSDAKKVVVVRPEGATTVVREDVETRAVRATTTEKVVSRAPGRQGPVGPEGAPSVIPGPTGPAGPPGAAGAAPQAYIHVQNSPANIWEIRHDLGFVPNVRVEDSAGTEYEVETEVVDFNNLRLSIQGGAFAGTAYLS